MESLRLKRKSINLRDEETRPYPQEHDDKYNNPTQKNGCFFPSIFSFIACRLSAKNGLLFRWSIGRIPVPDSASQPFFVVPNFGQGSRRPYNKKMVDLFQVSFFLFIFLEDQETWVLDNNIISCLFFLLAKAPRKTSSVPIDAYSSIFSFSPPINPLYLFTPYHRRVVFG